MTDIDEIVEEVERHEQNLKDFDDDRFGEIYLLDKESNND